MACKRYCFQWAATARSNAAFAVIAPCRAPREPSSPTAGQLGQPSSLGTESLLSTRAVPSDRALAADNLLLDYTPLLSRSAQRPHHELDPFG